MKPSTSSDRTGFSIQYPDSALRTLQVQAPDRLLRPDDLGCTQPYEERRSSLSGAWTR